MNRRVAWGSALLGLGVVTFLACVGDDPTASGTAAPDAGGSTDAPQTDETSSGGDSACTPNCGSSCVDLNTDGKNCGVCNHDCLGGKCGGGKCEAAALYSGTGTDASVSGIVGLVADGTNLFWVSPIPVTPGVPPARTTIYKCANQVPCAVPAVYFQQTDEVDSMISYTPGTLFLGDNTEGTIERMRTDGIDASAPSSCPSGNPCYFGSALGSSVVASNGPKAFIGSNGNGTNGLGVWSMNADGGAVSATLMNSAITGTPAVSAVTVDSLNGYVYAAFTNGTIRVYFTADSNAADEITVPSQTVVGQMLVAQSLVFWTRPDTGDVLTIPVCLGVNCNNHTVPTPTKFATTLDGGYAITNDATNLYWSAGSNIYSCPLTGCSGAPNKIAAGPARVHTITNDATAVYWGDDQGSVWKLAK